MKVGHQKIIKSGNIIELYEYEKPIPEINWRANQKRKISRYFSRLKTEKRKKLNKDDRKFKVPLFANIVRQGKSFRRIVSSNLTGSNAPVFITLTFVELVSIDKGRKKLRDFFERLRKDCGENVRYIGVPEYQKRGALHYHFLVWGLRDDLVFHEVPWVVRLNQKAGVLKRFLEWCKLKDLNATESRGDRKIQNFWGYGYVDLIPTDGSLKLASYFAKYMQKAMRDEKIGRGKAYNCSRNIMRPVSTSSKAIIAFSKELWDIDLSTETPLREKVFDTQWLGKGRYKLFKIN